MTANHLTRRGLRYFWRTNVAVVLGVATAVAVLTGALLVGDSVRGSLRDLVLQRLGRTDLVVASPTFFGADLAERLQADTTFAREFTSVVPLVAAEGLVSAQQSGRRADGVRVYGVDDRFWSFHGISRTGPDEGEALISPALAERIGAAAGDTVLVRLPNESAVPLESLHSRKDDLGRTLRLDVKEIVPANALGEFSLAPTQGDVRAVFVPLRKIQQELEVDRRVNTLLVSATGANGMPRLEALIRQRATLDDVRLTVRELAGGQSVSVESDAGVLTDAQGAAATKAIANSGLFAQPYFTYLANRMRVGDREVPYSLVSATDLARVGAGAQQTPPAGAEPPNGQDRPRIALNTWAADDLSARVGDTVTLEYFVWEEPGRLVTRSSDFVVSRVVSVAAGDRDMAPRFPGISDSPSLSDWDPPFPVDLKRVRPKDEAYWHEFRTTPKAFIELEVGQRLWRSRYGALTSVRGLRQQSDSHASSATSAAQAGSDIAAARQRVTNGLRASIDPVAMGIAVLNVRADGLAASRGATDFGEYFMYFSAFLVTSALLLVSLFFKLNVEQRVREIGLLRAVGFTSQEVRRLFLQEGAVLAGIGSAVGVLVGVGYAALLMYALRTWWVDAVGTTALSLHITPTSLLAGAAGGGIAAAVCIWWTLRRLASVSERSLLAGSVETDAAAASHGRTRTMTIGAAGFALAGVGLLVAAAAAVIAPAAGFFGAGAALLCGALCAFTALLRRPSSKAVNGAGVPALARIGFRNTTFRPGRSVLSVAVIAAAMFILVSVDAFRRGTGTRLDDPRSGSGGYPLLLETLVPVVRDPNTAEGRDALNLIDLDNAVTFAPFRLLPGDDASCLNLYAPTRPRILAPTDAFLAQGRFTFQQSVASTEAERGNPWSLLHRVFDDGAVPVIADGNSMTYVLHRALGEDVIMDMDGRPIRLRLVAALSDSVFQGELIMSDGNFRRLFPSEAGYRVFLVNAPPQAIASTEHEIEDRMGDVGAEVTTTGARLAEFHRVENTYLSTFQTLGGLGLLLGTVGLATVVLRNALERRRELALLGAVGYQRRHFLLMALAENAALLLAGLVAGAGCAMLAIAPAAAERGARIPLSAGGITIVVAVLVAGLLSSIVATRTALRGPLLDALRSE